MKIGYKTLLIAAALTTAISAHAQVAGTQPLSVTIRQSQALLEGWSVKQKPSCAMPTKRTRPSIRRRPARGTLVRYGDREVLGEARGQRVMIKSIHRDGVERRSAVKWANLAPLDDQLF